MGDVIGFASYVDTLITRNRMSRGVDGLCGQVKFTPRDRADLENWADAGLHVSMCSSEIGSFAMIYRSGQPWASWGLVRQGRSVLLWDCVSLIDIGRFPSMIDALAAVPLEDPILPVPNVLRFAALI